MLNTLCVHFLPQLTTAEELAAGTVVVLDILRASTTITAALDNGASRVIPCLEVADAQKTAATLPAGTALLGGERGGLPIAGFDVGNSPAEYIPTRVRDKTVVFTTTNGTLAMSACRLASEVLVGSFVNLTAVADRLAAIKGKRPIHLLCAGTRGRITREDVLCAGAICQRMFTSLDDHSLNDQAWLALEAWQGVIGPANAARGRAWLDLSHSERETLNHTERQHLLKTLANTQGGRNLRGIGLESDLALAAKIDQSSRVPMLDLQTWVIT
ncbi:MAG: 2-phosphosulfolactate phosphatase [Pirellulales bacterium]|nr:2-phosphosulfolactate phosphatase [Pirellulales bacterium]